MTRRILNQKELREDYDNSERQLREEENQDEMVDREDEEENEEPEGAEESAADEDNGEEAPKTKPVKVKVKGRSRAAKIVRLKVVWGVFNNSNQRVAVFEYPKRQEADELAARLRTEKRGMFFVQAVKEPMEQKKDEVD
jgi:hypothetical protein